jgi:hypothetical protein
VHLPLVEVEPAKAVGIVPGRLHRCCVR